MAVQNWETVMNVVRQLFAFGPILFGIGFIAPLVHEILIRLNWDMLILSHSGLTFTVAIPTLLIGLVIGAGWGIFAFFRKSWI